MIRIDEIYYNIFLPSVQRKSFHGIHWFDPFGSVAFENMCSAPPVPWDDRAVRYLFWDQEPLHKDLIDSTLTRYCDTFNGQLNLVTSELNSEFVDYACNTYGLRSHYYFYHGWASLDWFRGYNRSFLIPDPKDRNINNTFISPNRIIAGQRQHRLIMMYHIIKNNLINNYISFPKTCPVENISVLDAVSPLLAVFPDIADVFAQAKLPFNFINEANHPMHSYKLSLYNECADSLLYLVTETVGQGRRLHLTEKTFKPICLRMPFIIVGTAGSLEYLHRYGFKTFESLWDESYDLELDDVKRIEKIAKVLSGLDTLTIQEKQQLYKHSNEILEHNYNHFYNGGFENILWKELTNMIENF